MALARALVPIGARVISLMIHGAELHRPGGLRRLDQCLTVAAVKVACCRCQLRQDALSHQRCVALDADGHRLREANAGLVDVDLDKLGLRGPIADAIRRQCGEGVQAGSQSENHVCLRDQLHRCFGAVVAQGARVETMASGERVVVLVVAAHRRREPLGQLLRGRDAALGQDHSGPVQDHGEACLREQLRRGLHRPLPAGRALQIHALGQLDLDDLGPHVPRDIDLCGRAAADGLLNHTVQDLTDAGRVAHLLLVAHAVLKHGQLLDLLEASLSDGLVGCLGCDKQQRRVVPVGCLHWGHEVGDAWSVLCYHHGHPARDAAEAIAHHPSVALVGAIPELDARRRENVRDGHHRRADDAKGVVNPPPLQHLDEGLLRGHAHGALPRRGRCWPCVRGRGGRWCAGRGARLRHGAERPGCRGCIRREPLGSQPRSGARRSAAGRGPAP
mmetsp:Transcript_22188/g.61468  ORF Transcript_22188/g.61468 Transcript_22188/m.61468 type:complete len:445 (+) Transcript_22188:907-2241(+)